jgi:hypothetical protein
MRMIAFAALALLAGCATRSSMRPPLTSEQVAWLLDSTADREVVYVTPRIGQEQALTDFVLIPEGVSGNGTHGKVTIPLHDVYTLRWHERSGGAKTGALLGLIGGSFGTLAVINSTCHSDEGLCTGAAFYGFLAGAILGSILGGGIGALIGADARVTIERSSPPAR